MLETLFDIEDTVKEQEDFGPLGNTWPAMNGFDAGNLLHDDILCTHVIGIGISSPCEYPRCRYIKDIADEFHRSNLTSGCQERGSCKSSWKACNCLDPVVKVQRENLVVGST